MSAWWLLPLALAACLAVLAIAACLSPKPRHAAPRRHLAVAPEPAPSPVGSMILAEERAFYTDGQAVLCAGCVGFEHCDGIEGACDCTCGWSPRWADEPDWRDQIAADLAPEALDSDVQPDPYLDAIAAELVSEYDEDDCLMECDPDCESGPYHCWWIHQPSHKRGWHSLADCPHDSGPGSSSSVAPGPDWLDGQLAVLYEWVRDQYAAAAA